MTRAPFTVPQGALPQGVEPQGAAPQGAEPQGPLPQGLTLEPQEEQPVVEVPPHALQGDTWTRRTSWHPTMSPHFSLSFSQLLYDEPAV